jgi:hypothetical protein
MARQLSSLLELSDEFQRSLGTEPLDVLYLEQASKIFGVFYQELREEYQATEQEFDEELLDWIDGVRSITPAIHSWYLVANTSLVSKVIR